MPATSVDAEREYDDERFAAREVFRTGRSKTVCGYFEPGQFIPVHAPESDVTIVVRSGEGVVRDGDDEHDVSPGSVVAVPAGRDRGVRADGDRLEEVLVTAPPPTDAETTRYVAGSETTSSNRRGDRAPGVTRQSSERPLARRSC